MPERRFIREALLALGSERPELRDAVRAVRRWGVVLDLAQADWVANSVWAGISTRGLEAEIPEPVRSKLASAHAHATARNALLLHEAASMQAALASSRIDSVVLKGPGLVVAHYPGLGDRHVGDVDLLVREEDLPVAEALVRAAGARELSPPVSYDGTRREVGQRNPQGEIVLVSPLGIALELHDRIAGGARDGSDVQGVLARARTVTWKGRPLRIPSAPDLAAGACQHVVDHHASDSRFVARLLPDLAVLVGSGAVAWSDVEARMPPGSGRTALRFSRRLLEQGPPGRLAISLLAIRVRAGNWMEVLAANDGSPGHVVQVFFPSRAYLASRYRIEQRSPLLPLLYLWRPVRGLWALLTGRR